MIDLAKKVDVIGKLYKHLKEELLLTAGIKMHKDSTEIISLFFGDKKILVIDADVDDNDANGFYNHPTRRSGDLFVFFDKNFRTLARFVNQRVPDGYSKFEKCKEYNQELYDLISKFKAFANRNKKNKLEHYRSLNDYELKKFFASQFKVPFTADKEFFFFDNDEVQPRFRGKVDAKLKPKIDSIVKINDSSALLLVHIENGKEVARSIDIDSHGYVIGNKIYYGLRSYLKIVKAKQEDCDFVRYDSATKKKQYFKYQKMTVSKKVLDATPYFLFKKADQMKFVLKYDAKKKRYYLVDLKGKEVALNHPDLLIEEIS